MELVEYEHVVIVKSIGQATECVMKWCVMEWCYVHVYASVILSIMPVRVWCDVCVCVCMCVCMCVCACVCVCMCTHTHTHTQRTHLIHPQSHIVS